MICKEAAEGQVTDREAPVDDFADLYLETGDVWPDGLSIRGLCALRAAPVIGDFIGELGREQDE